ncbi:Uncharacterised protein [Serratia quinivorans]|nr:Uncharacterised protein [Serratia quinivorans]
MIVKLIKLHEIIIIIYLRALMIAVCFLVLSLL